MIQRHSTFLKCPSKSLLGVMSIMSLILNSCAGLSVRAVYLTASQNDLRALSYTKNDREDLLAKINNLRKEKEN